MGKYTAEIADCSCRNYQLCKKYEPPCKRDEGKEQVVFTIDVQGYRKPELHVEIDNRTLIIRGERSVAPWVRQSFRKTIKLEGHWKKEEIRSSISPSGELSIEIPKGQKPTIRSAVRNPFSILNSKMKETNSRLKAYGTLAFNFAVLASLLIQIIIMVKCVCSTNV